MLGVVTTGVVTDGSSIDVGITVGITGIEIAGVSAATVAVDAGGGGVETVGAATVAGGGVAAGAVVGSGAGGLSGKDDAVCVTTADVKVRVVATRATADERTARAVGVAPTGAGLGAGETAEWWGGLSPATVTAVETPAPPIARSAAPTATLA
jgi:hypothetical protein